MSSSIPTPARDVEVKNDVPSKSIDARFIMLSNVVSDNETPTHPSQ